MSAQAARNLLFSSHPLLSIHPRGDDPCQVAPHRERRCYSPRDHPLDCFHSRLRNHFTCQRTIFCTLIHLYSPFLSCFSLFIRSAHTHSHASVPTAPITAPNRNIVIPSTSITDNPLSHCPKPCQSASAATALLTGMLLDCGGDCNRY